MKKALISVSDKTGVIEFAKELVALGYEILSTGGTAKALKENNIACTEVSDYTGFSEALDGRVKTLHPKLHGGILALRDNNAHMQQLSDLGISPIDIVCVNLYPFKQTISKPDCEFSDAVENIDIGGPSMIRAAAKNYSSVLVLVDSDDYSEIIDRLKADGVDLDFRKKLMAKAFSHTASYDALISNYLNNAVGEKFPKELALSYLKKQDLRYGENPHQQAAVYEDLLVDLGSVISSKQLQGKELSFNNINDTAAALELLNEFSGCACVAVKHATACGVALGESVFDAYQKAYLSDPVSIFGGIVAFNRKVDLKTAKELNKTFLEIVIAPEYSNEALQEFSRKPNLRILKTEHNVQRTVESDIKIISGGVLVQDIDAMIYNKTDIVVVTKLKPTKKQMQDLDFAFTAVKHIKSNAIVLVKDGALVGQGGGQTNRVDALKLAIDRAGERAKGAVLGSDAFFPFSDCVELAACAGIKSIIQPGGSVRDQDSIDACNNLGLSMVFTGTRHFKH